MVSRNIVYLDLFHVVWSVFAVVFLTLILFSSFSIDHDLFWSIVELNWSFKVSAVGFQALVHNSLCIYLLGIRTWRHVVWRQGAL